MMGQIISDLENPETVEAEGAKAAEGDIAEEQAPEAERAAETRKTVSQTLREWDISSVERIIIDHNEEGNSALQQKEEAEKAVNRPWFSRKK